MPRFADRCRRRDRLSVSLSIAGLLLVASCVAPPAARYQALRAAPAAPAARAPRATSNDESIDDAIGGGSAAAPFEQSHRWLHRGTLRLYVEANSELPDFTPRHLALVDEAIRAWSETGAVRIERVYWPYEADIRLVWTDRLPTTHPGITLLHPADDGRLVRADIFIDARPAPWPTGTPDRVLYCTIAHELGHALGLPHDPSIGSLMHAAPVVTRVTERDLTRLDRLVSGR